MTFNLPITRWQYYYAVIGALLIGFSLFLLMTRGLNFETDFKGGLKLQYMFSKDITEGQLREILGTVTNIGSFSIQRIGETSEKRYVIKTELPEIEQGIYSENITKTLADQLGKEEVVLEKADSVGPKAGKELRRKGQLAVIVSWLLMLIYIGWRFDFFFAPGAIIALIHDVIITLGAFSLWQVDFSLTSVAALLTIIGYSINDTIVVYDRIRENLQKYPERSTGDIISTSVNETLSRTIITSLTVLFVVVVLFVVSEGEIKNFAFAMIVGAVFGMLSTIFVASPVYQILKKISLGTPFEKKSKMIKGKRR
ncbi:MAG: protein-export membrane protein SecF [Deltaproteobacteria bacterium RIFCSPLOWO2_02_FULL_50_16]|nr:MAG: protein-export membrane protein SecF [Deltaproteobacteria bacterium RIFCSPHIGHO2_02_FULL_50_15]OGQ58300.1 MAG: protein-export membrane protein SecF [Deltaproteobacteria bacterium RIFCSPLOWO2_02_FULL_50_16]